MSLRILLNGAKGRMGRAIAEATPKMGAQISAAIDVGDSAEAVIGGCDVVIDFSFHAATLPLARICAAHGRPLVIGTTGHDDAERAAIVALADRVPIVWAGNYSLGVNLLNYLVGKAARALPDDFNPEIIEMHHNLKKDAPSGTAERLVEVIREARGLSREQERHGRHGLVGERPSAEIGIHAIRGGDIVGDHTVIFAGQGERLEFRHIATDRRIFAQGAVRAAQWLAGRKPGLFNMEDVLGLRD